LLIAVRPASCEVVNFIHHKPLKPFLNEKIYLLVPALFLLPVMSTAQCLPSFSWTQSNPNEITFNNTHALHAGQHHLSLAIW
jgi:hypothetical protein